MPDINQNQNSTPGSDLNSNLNSSLNSDQSFNQSFNQNTNLNMPETLQDDVYLPESPETPVFGPPSGTGNTENVPASPGGPLPLPTPSLPDSETPAPSLPGAGLFPFPNRPGNNQQWPPIAIYPIPIYPGGGQNNNQQGFCTLRFLNAAVGYESLNISIGSKRIVNNLQYSTVSSYFTEIDGFQTINVALPQMPGRTIASETLLFNDGDVYTIALINTMDGISMLPVSDVPCRNQNPNFACIRTVNLSYNSPALDVEVQTANIAFHDVRFKTVTPYRQIRQGSQTFQVFETESGAPGFSITAWIEPLKMYTLYMVGDAYAVPGISGVFTEDSSLLM